MGFPWPIYLIMAPLCFCDQLNFDEAVMGLSELPLEKLLHVQKKFTAADKGNDEPEGVEVTGRPEAMALVSPATRRGGHKPSYGYSAGKGKGKGKGVSAIFQGSVTTLAFLAFGGYLLCLIVQAVRANGGTTTMVTPTTTGGATAPLVFVRPVGRRRRRRSNTDSSVDGLYESLLHLAEGYSAHHSHSEL